MALEFSAMSRRGQWSVIAGLCLAAMVVFYIYVWSANQDRIRQVSSQISQLEMEIQRTRVVAAQLPELEAELERLEQRLEVLMHILPEALETDQLLRRVQAAASDSNLNIRRATFQDPIPQEFYAEYPIALELSGTYHNLARFFDRIGKFARIINVDQVTVQAFQGAGVETVQAACTAKTFFFLEEPAQPAEPEEQRPGQRRRSR